MIILLGLITIFTSGLTAFLGIGGGLTLVAILPLFLPIPAVVPIHGVVQLASNISRAVFSWRDVLYQYLFAFFIGGLVGVVTFSLLLHVMSFDYLPLFIGGYILLSQWSSLFNRLVMQFENFVMLGFIHVGMGTLVGTPGPVHMALLMKRTDNHDQVVATIAAMASISHTLKIIAFVMLGVKLWEYLGEMTAMVVGAVIGSYLGTCIRHQINGECVKGILKIMLSLLAISMIVNVFL